MRVHPSGCASVEFLFSYLYLFTLCLSIPFVLYAVSIGVFNLLATITVALANIFSFFSSSTFLEDIILARKLI